MYSSILDPTPLINSGSIKCFDKTESIKSLKPSTCCDNGR